MHIRTTLLAAGAAAAATSAAIAWPAGASLEAKNGCDRGFTQTIVANSSRRVYFYQRVIDDDTNAVQVRVAECKPGSTDDPRLIAKFNNSDETPSVVPETGAIRGRYLVIEFRDTTGAPKRVLRLYDMAARKYLARYDRAGTSVIGEYLTNRGALAVIAPGGGLVAFDSAGARRIAPAGTSDYAAGPTRMYWQASGVEAGVPLGGPPQGTLVDPPQ